MASGCPKCSRFFSIVHGQSQNETCEVYVTDHDTTVSSVTQGMSTTPLLNGERYFFFFKIFMFQIHLAFQMTPKIPYLRLVMVGYGFVIQLLESVCLT